MPPAEAGARGFALVSVLWGVAILSLIASAVLYASVQSVQLSRNDTAQAELAAAADAGVARAILALLDNRPGSQGPHDGTPRSFAFNGVAVRVSIADENGKIDLNKASPDLLAALFESAGLATNAAQTLAGRVAAWRAPAGGGDAAASNEDYRSAGLAWRPRGGPFQSVDELRLVLGMSAPLFRRVEPALTIYARQTNPDMATAPRQVLLALPGMDASRAAQMIAARTGQAASGAPSAAGHAFAIRAEVRAGATDFVRQTVVAITGDAARPYFFYDWR